MTNRRPSLGSHLEWHNGSIRVTVAVPRAMQSAVGATRLKRPLHTDSPANAERLKHGVIQELKDRIAEAAQIEKRGKDSVAGEALAWRADIEASDNRNAAALSEVLIDRATEIERASGLAAAKEFHDIATGVATPIASLVESYVVTSGLGHRSVDEVRRSVRAYLDWAAEAGSPQTIEGLSRKVAGRFVSERLLPQMTRATAAKYLSFLSGYWKWLRGKGYCDDIPWSGQLEGVGKGKAKRSSIAGTSTRGGKRPYTPDEARKLLYPASWGTPDIADRTHDITWIGALSGMRIDEICRLRAGDCVDGWFNINSLIGEGKTEAAVRRIPIHSRLAEIVARRIKGKAPGAYLIEDLPEPPRGSGRERSMPASKAYTRYRRSVGIDERGEGQRQSNVDFHSWRRWFIREAREAGQTIWTIADVVGHDAESLPGGLTMATYPGAASDSALRECVEAVQPPKQS